MTLFAVGALKLFRAGAWEPKNLACTREILMAQAFQPVPALLKPAATFSLEGQTGGGKILAGRYCPELPLWQRGK
jgi:hypothetical protein